MIMGTGVWHTSSRSIGACLQVAPFDAKIVDGKIVSLKAIPREPTATPPRPAPTDPPPSLTPPPPAPAHTVSAERRANAEARIAEAQLFFARSKISADARDDLMLAAADIMGDRHEPLVLDSARRTEEERRLDEPLRAIQQAVAHQLYLDHGIDDNATALSEELRTVYGTKRITGTVVQSGMQGWPGAGRGTPRYDQHRFQYHYPAPTGNYASTSWFQPEPGHLTLPLSPTLQAKVGFEFEIPGAKSPLGTRGEVLIEGAGWRLETDQGLSGTDSDLEFVLAPMSSMRDIANALKEIIDLVALMRARALDTPTRTFRLSQITYGLPPGAVLRKDTPVTVYDLRFSAVMQATYGIRLADIAGVVDELFDAKQALEIHQMANAVRRFYEMKYATPLSRDVSGFVELIAMYLRRAKQRSMLGYAR